MTFNESHVGGLFACRGSRTLGTKWTRAKRNNKTRKLSLFLGEELIRLLVRLLSPLRVYFLVQDYQSESTNKGAGSEKNRINWIAQERCRTRRARKGFDFFCHFFLLKRFFRGSYFLFILREKILRKY